MSSKMPVLITAEEAAEYQSWSLPGFDDNPKVLPTAEKEARNRQEVEDQQPAASSQVSGPDTDVEQGHAEIIEDVEADDVSFSPITAEELQAITEAAEQEGFDKGKAEGLVSGHKEGLDRGYQEGLKKAQAEATQKLNEQVANLQSVAQGLIEPIAEQNHQLERLLTDFTCAMTRQLVERELLTDSSHVLANVKKGLAALPVGADFITLYLNPDDLALVESYAEKKHEKWGFVGDDELLPGGCRIKTDVSLVDYSVETQLSELLQQFKNKQLVGEDDGSQFDYPTEPEIEPEIEPEAEPEAEVTTETESHNIMQDDPVDKRQESPDESV